MRIAPHRQPRNTEREQGSDVAEGVVGAGAPGAAVGDKADAVAARGLGPAQVEHMAEQPAGRCAKDVQDVQGRHRLRARLLQPAARPRGKIDRAD